MIYEYNNTGHRYPSAHRLGCISGKPDCTFIQALKDKYGYTFDPNTKMMLPPNKANGLPALTKEIDNIIK